MMSFIFSPQDLASREKAYTFDDVLLMPCRSAVASRFHVDVSTKVTRRVALKLPVVAANMDTISEAEMCLALNSIGAAAILHRFMTIEEQVAQVQKVKAGYQEGMGMVAASVGVNQDSKERAGALVKAGAQVITLDIAHGHSEAMIEMIRFMKKEFPAVDVIAGNVATPKATEDLIAAGADAIKVGIGPGSMCTTRIITGVGMPQLSAIAVCSAIAHKSGIPVIADGGIRTSGDAMKALAAGADCVMVGNVLSGANETPGEIVHGKKMYRGMASRAAQVSWRGGQLPEGMAPEGESTFVACKGPVKDIVNEFVGGIRSGMSYLNARTIAEIPETASFVEVSGNCLRENVAHGTISR
jgi:IMP dehydrogenase